jgi:Amidases related to nicotinamidase
MKKYLIVVDMQNDFVSGSLGSKEAVEIVPKVKQKIENFDGTVIFTRDTHEQNYLETAEGKKLPVVHCVRNTSGWEICDELKELCMETPIDKPTFGSVALAESLAEENGKGCIYEIVLVGLCTDVCVISNAVMLKAFLPEVKITVDAACCAGVTPKSHKNALSAMQGCQIDIENGDQF